MHAPTPQLGFMRSWFHLVSLASLVCQLSLCFSLVPTLFVLQATKAVQRPGNEAISSSLPLETPGRVAQPRRWRARREEVPVAGWEEPGTQETGSEGRAGNHILNILFSYYLRKVLIDQGIAIYME